MESCGFRKLNRAAIFNPTEPMDANATPELNPRGTTSTPAPPQSVEPSPGPAPTETQPGTRTPGNGSHGPARAPGNGSASGTGSQGSTSASDDDTKVPSKAHLAQKADDAVLLLEFAAESGIDIGDDIRSDILKASFAANGSMDEQTATRFLSSVTKLAAKVSPVTAESLRACQGKTGRFYFYWALCLGLPTVLFSIAAFVSSGLSDNIRQDVSTANVLAVKLTEELEPPATNPPALERGLVRPLPAGVVVNDVLQDLQTFAGAIRAIDRRTLQLNRFLLTKWTDELGTNRENRELNLQMLNTNLPAESEFRIRMYQNVRYRAQNASESVSLWYGAVAKYILPLLYALLGACAYLARRLEREVNAHTFVGDDRHRIHFVIAGIGGLVVGLFTNSSTTQGASLPPLALAFLVGYAVNVFFRFLESLTEAIYRGRDDPDPQPSKPAPKN